jgi:hypothetical protein
MPLDHADSPLIRAWLWLASYPLESRLLWYAATAWLALGALGLLRACA